MAKSEFNQARRDVLKTLAAGASALGFSGVFGDYSQAFAQGSQGDDLKTIIDLAATAETFACTHYYNVLKTGTIKFNAQQVNQIKAALNSELDHLQFLIANGAKPLVTSFFFPFKIWAELDTFVTVTEQGEAIFVGAYLAAIRRIVELGNPLLAATTAQVVGVEAQHLALFREMGGKLGNNVSLLEAPFFNTSDAVPSLTPFLKGGPGFESTAAKYPGDGAIRTFVGSNGVTVLKPYTDPSAVKKTIVTPAAGS